MAHFFLIFDFGRDEDAVQQARHRIEGWRQGFRLDKKLQLKIERKELEEKEDATPEPSQKPGKGRASGKSAPKTNSKKKTAAAEEPEEGSTPTAPADIRMIVRLDFSDHEKLSRQRWLDRIPTEEPFKNANPKVIRPGETDFDASEELFESLD